MAKHLDGYSSLLHHQKLAIVAVEYNSQAFGASVTPQ